MNMHLKALILVLHMVLDQELFEELLQVEKKTKPETGGAVTEYSDYDGDYSEDASDVERYYSGDVERQRNRSKYGYKAGKDEDSQRNFVGRNHVKPSRLTKKDKYKKMKADSTNQFTTAVNNGLEKKRQIERAAKKEALAYK